MGPRDSLPHGGRRRRTSASRLRAPGRRVADAIGDLQAALRVGVVGLDGPGCDTVVELRVADIERHIFR